TAPASQDPAIAPEWEDPAGVPISAVLLGGRRSSVVPLIHEATSWQHGVFLGSIMASETTAAAKGTAGVLRRDPFAMLPFCGYNMADYFGHWLSMAERTNEENLPKIFYVNWFRKDANGKWLWPGYGENSRVLEWVFNRVDNNALAKETSIGLIPTTESLKVDGLDMSSEDLEALLEVDDSDWRNEIPSIEEHYAKFGDKLPKALRVELENLKSRLGI
ncbi:MAG: phosphoenolpyruvate carboxykinase (GTP), partial [Acidimicrobiales bacterium]|nr:phosphoenolpyruvate carboxykinase (GTP) [Acidimicrobiales bacterium]